MTSIVRNTHPGHLDRYLEGQAGRLHRLGKTIAETDATDAEALKKLLGDVVGELVQTTQTVAALSYAVQRR